MKVNAEAGHRLSAHLRTHEDEILQRWVQIAARTLRSRRTAGCPAATAPSCWPGWTATRRWPGGRTTAVQGRVALLGVPTPHHGESVVTLDPGDLLVLVTDGLIERRGFTFDEGMDRLGAWVTTPTTTSPCW
ncbi:SpoIIE family protein phosphatase [Dactylosporangium sp. NPDC051485]|uniref:SpoIIE family protein phosphatase n=1 Tax=Dactylosporangium sp. NPDC051485 TaxID=3154846 RepID=UPI003421E66B